MKSIAHLRIAALPIPPRGINKSTMLHRARQLADAAFTRRDFLTRCGMGMGAVASASLSEGCLFRNAMWSTPDSCSVPIELSKVGVQTKEFNVRAGRYGVYLAHQVSCKLFEPLPGSMYPNHPKNVGCDIDVKVTYRNGAPIVFQKRTTQAGLMNEGLRVASYDLGYFEIFFGGKFTLVISNAPSSHDDSVCKSCVQMVEYLPK